MSDTLAGRRLRAVWHSCTQMKRHEAQPPIAITRAQGPWLEAEEVRLYLDGVSSWWVNCWRRPKIGTLMARGEALSPTLKSMTVLQL